MEHLTKKKCNIELDFCSALTGPPRSFSIGERLHYSPPLVRQCPTKNIPGFGK